jgi:iron complex transport system substrate-binding protein
MDARPRSAPRRIVCLTEEPTEILYALGEGDRVVGISAWTKRPPEARRDKPVVSAFVGANVERIAALRPDLVIGFSDVQAKLAAELVSANLPVLILSQRTIAEILDVVLLLGRIADAKERAEALVAGYVRHLDEVRRRHASSKERPRVYFEEWPDPMITASRWVSELIEVAGGVDVFADRSAGRAARERVVTSEEVVARAPDVILASWCGKPLEREAVLSRPGWEDVPAVRREALHELDACLVLQPGPASLTDGLDERERRIHGAAAARAGDRLAT